MPVKKCNNGKYRIGRGRCMYATKAAADRALKAYYAKKKKEMKTRIIGRRRKRSYEVALQTKIWFWWFDDTVYYFRHPDQEYEVIADKILDLSNEHNAPIARVERIITKTGKHGQNKSKALPG